MTKVSGELGSRWSWSLTIATRTAERGLSPSQLPNEQDHLTNPAIGKSHPKSTSFLYFALNL